LSCIPEMDFEKSLRKFEQTNISAVDLILSHAFARDTLHKIGINFYRLDKTAGNTGKL